MSAWWVLGAIFSGLLVLYYILLARAVLEMLRREANAILMTFSFLALVPLPPLLVLGVLILIIWGLHREAMPEAS